MNSRQSYRNLFRWSLLILLGLFHSGISAQDIPEFNMSDTTISVCTGILYDSGGEDGLYDNNSNLTTVINPGGIITLTFENIFNVETNLDFLYIYDGPDTGAPLLGVFTGTTLPPVLIATSGAVTLVFTSDNSAIYAGFTMMWESDNPPPVPPVISVDTNPVCNSTTVDVTFSYPIACEWLTTATWSVSSSGDEIGVIAVDDQCAQDSTTVVTLTLDQAFTYNCDFMVDLEIGIPDDCELIYIFPLSTTFTYAGCGIDGSISSSALAVCPGECAELTALSEGCLTYSYTWNNGIPDGPGPHTVCPVTNTTYTVTITEQETGVSDQFSFTLLVQGTSIITPDQTLCQSEPLLELEAEIDGTWSGPGVEDEELGLFEPDSAMAGLNIIYFESSECLDSILITIIPISTDNITAACPGTTPFQLNAEPAGGVWDGPFTTSDGIFDPSVEGSYIVTYTTAQCQDTLIVNIDNITGTFVLDTICQSVWTDTIDFSPLGGYFEGPGIIDSLLGVYAPSEMPPGWVQLHYYVNGCDEMFEVYVKEINIGAGFATTCPLEDPQVFYEDPFTPEGGYWEGEGIIDTASGLFDPGLVPDDYYATLIYYAPNGCSDTTTVYNRLTTIGLDTAWFCLNDDAFELIEENIEHSPSWGGEWLGSGLDNPWDDYWTFDPSAAGVGIHHLTYLRNTCTDSLVAVVFPDEVEPVAFGFCSNESPVLMDPDLMQGGFWYGPGITDPLTGEFDPGAGLEGSNFVYWLTPAGCTDSVMVSIEVFEQTTVTGLDPVYCFQNTDVPVEVTPSDALVTGIDPDLIFNPAEAGEGSYTIIASWTGEYCSSSDTAVVSVLPPLEIVLEATDSTICGGAGSTLTVTASGGNPDLNYQYSWDDGSFPVNTNTVSPDETIWVGVEVSDGCSDPVTDSLLITVLEAIQVAVSTSDTLCFGDEGFAAAEVISAGTFSTAWDGTESPNITDAAGSVHQLTVTDLINGCEFDSLILIPNYPPISAAFSINPNFDCVAGADADNISLIDLSQNAVGGTWNFGNGTTAPYSPGETPQPDYPGAGSYEISLVVYNVGNCPDSTIQTLCVLPQTPLFIPDIFSPNGDRNNDTLFVRGVGIRSMVFLIYDRWGEKVYESYNPKDGWDGDLRGAKAPSGNYVYYLRAVMLDGSIEERKGEVALIR